MATVEQHDVIVIGAGFGGLYATYLLRNSGFDVIALERGSGVGGTWYWNRYPGARCDVESLQYSYSFDKQLEQEWEWSERYAGQPEILEYAEHVASRFDLEPNIRFDTNVEKLDFSEGNSTWTVSTNGTTYRAPFVVAATGCLSTANHPEFEGINDFQGGIYHTGKWPHEGVDFTGQRVAVIGTGSSAVQSIPVIAQQAAQLTVFQRTPNYSVPARNEPLEPQTQADVKADYENLRRAARSERSGILTTFPLNEDSAKEADEADFRSRMDERWEYGGFSFYRSYADIVVDPTSNERVAEYVRERIANVVEDSDLATLLSPSNTIACKRPCLDTDYYETFNNEHVELVDISVCGIDRLTRQGVIAGGSQYDFDAIVFATGFDAMTGALLGMNITGRDELSLDVAWEAGPRTYLGLSVPHFPNLFTVTGPGSPSVLTNMIVAIEQHVEWICACLRSMRSEGRQSIEATDAAADSWVDHVNTVADETLYPSCNSWYLGSNIPGKTRVFMPLIGFPTYAEKCEEVAANGYSGFVLT